MRILIADDEPETRTVVRRILMRHFPCELGEVVALGVSDYGFTPVRPAVPVERVARLTAGSPNRPRPAVRCPAQPVPG